MEPSALLSASYLDIVFDNRNKNYGAYELRKNYDRRVRKSALFLLLGTSAFICLSFIDRSKATPPPPNVHTFDPTLVEVQHTKEIHPPIVPPKPPAAPAHIRTTIFTPPVIAPADEVKPEQVPQTVTPGTQPGLANADGDTTGLAEVPGTGTGTVIRETQPAEVSKPFTWVEQMPEFVGDRDEYMAKHLDYPQRAMAENIEGRVLVAFVVNADGSISDAKVVQGIGGGCDEEALRMVTGMPHWKPGKHNGVPVKVFFVLPIKFVLKI